MDLRTRLNENKLEMEKNKKKLQDAYLVQKRLYELTEKNHIYDELEVKFKKQTDQIRLWYRMWSALSYDKTDAFSRCCALI